MFLADALPVAAAETTSTGRLAFAASRGADGNFEIYSADLAGEQAVNLTNDPAPDRSPSWSPDGRRIVFASQRNQNWDLYLMDADGGNLQRLTDSPAYDGEPSWSPDGRRIAFSSTRDGNLEIYLLELATNEVRRLTDHEEADYGPSWSPDSQQLAFTSWRDQQQEIYTLDTREAGIPQAVNRSNDPAPDYSPAWAADGRRIAFVSDRYGTGNLLIMDLQSSIMQQAGPTNRSLQDPAWTSTGDLIAAGTWLSSGQRFSTRQGVLITGISSPVGVFLVGSTHTYAEPDWSANAPAPQAAADLTTPGRDLATQSAPADLDEIPEGFTSFTTVRSGGRPMLATAVYDSFAALRQATIQASGHDFLAQLSEASRAVDFRSASSSYTSWHKSGRAFDTLFSYNAGGREALYIVPERIAGRLLWRLYLRAAAQDGSQGAPLTTPIFSTGDRNLYAPPSGYFVDFTALAAQYGWQRIAAQEREDFNWRSQLLALEYWHFERRDNLSWYQAMSLVHAESTLERLFSVEALVNGGASPNSLGRLGLPWAAAPNTPSATPRPECIPGHPC